MRTEIASYEKVCTILSGQDVATEDDRVVSKRSRGLSETWQKVVYWIHSQTTPPETDDIFAYTQFANLNVVRTTLRSQLSVYTQQGILARHDGHYVVTAQGLKLLQNIPNDEPVGQEEPDEYSSAYPNIPANKQNQVELDDEIPF